MKTYSIGILGATGAVGREMMKILSERGFPVGNIRLFASERSAGKIMTFMGNEVTLENADGADFSGLYFVLGAVSSDLAKKFAPKIISSGAVFIDNSSAFRSDERIPLVIPEINPTDAFSHSGIISNPNCSTIITLVAANALCRLSPIKAMIASTYQAVSGAGEGGIRSGSQGNPRSVPPRDRFRGAYKISSSPRSASCRRPICISACRPLCARR